jgi:uncharacterized NAD(P)/FAD-binding protein YdhS
MLNNSEFFDVAIVGGGYSGSVLAIHILRHSGRGAKVAIIDPRLELGAGVAYSVRDETARINVPARLMGVSSEPDDRFLGWLQAEQPDLVGPSGGIDPAETYVARHWFGAFVRCRLADTMTKSRARLSHIPASVTDARWIDGGIELALASAPGFPIRARQVVIATSHGIPAVPAGVPPWVPTAPGFIADPWRGDGLAQIDRGDDVLIVGTGLTMADTVASLLARGHRGHIAAFSRHGLVPRSNGGSAAPAGLDFAAWPPAPVSHYVRRIREEILRIEAEGGSWRDVFTALREQSERLWSKLPIWEKRRFLRHLKCYYDAHRYRMAPDIATRIDEARRNGQVDILAARLHDISAEGGGFRVSLVRRSSRIVERRDVAAIVNCTGPTQRLHADPGHFLGALIARGLAYPDSLGLGLMVDKDFRVYGLCRNFYALGPLTRERFGDTMGAPEIMAQAQLLARVLAEAERHAAA